MTEEELLLTEGGTEYAFVVLPTEDGGKHFALSTEEWQPGQPLKPWRVPLHEWAGGLGRDKLKSQPVYAKANADVSFGSLVPPPKLNSFIARSYEYLYGAQALAYGGSAYGGVTYSGAVTSIIFSVSRRLGNKEYIGGGNAIYSIDASYSVTLEKEFAVNEDISDIEVLNDKLYVAMGETVKMWEYVPDTNTWTQATDNVFAIALGTVNEKLWRGESDNKLSNCITAPLTLASWAPSSPNQYSVGDSTYPIKDIIEYLDEPWIEKADGIYAPNERAEYRNQTPQLKNWPNGCDCKSMFTARGYLWAESPAGLLRINRGESYTVGPEKTGRPDFRFHTHGGVQFGDDIYLLCSDRALTSEAFIAKLPAGDAEVEPGVGFRYRYHELVRLGSVDPGGFIALSNLPVSPSVLAGQNGTVHYFKLGRGGGRHIDDALYEYGLTLELEVGAVSPVEDLAVECVLVGVEALLDADASESFSLQYAIEEGAYSNLLNTQEGAGVAPISATTGYERARRYAPANTVGHYFRFKLTGTLNASLGTDRPEVHELWAFGYAHPSVTDRITFNLLADNNVTYKGIRLGRTPGEQLRLLRRWKNNGTVLIFALPDYEEGRTLRCCVVAVEEASINTRLDNTVQHVAAHKVALMRIDYASAYASA